jgi:predicted dehydrogenase
MPWAAGLEDLATSIVDGRPPALDARNAVHVVEVIEAILDSAATGRPVSVEAAVARPPAAAWAVSLPLPD